MEIQTLQFFMDVAEKQSFSVAAEDENISQSSLSKAILRLEDELNVRLFDRRQRPVALTPAGKCFYSDMKDFLPRYEQALEHIRAFSGQKYISVEAVPSLMPLFLNGRIRRFHDENPHVQVTLENTPVLSQALARLRAGETDFLVAHRPLEPHPDLRETFLCSDRLCVVVPMSHRFAAQTEVHLDQLNGERFLLTAFGNSTIHELMDAYAFCPGDIRALPAGSRRETLFQDLDYEHRINLCYESDINVFRWTELKSIPVTDVSAQPFVLLERTDMVLRAHHEKFKQFLQQSLQSETGR